jgi:hypothetical protein
MQNEGGFPTKEDLATLNKTTHAIPLLGIYPDDVTPII